MTYATIDNTAKRINDFHRKYMDNNPTLQAMLVRSRDEEERQLDPAKDVVGYTIDNIGSENHPNWQITFDYSNGDQWRYSGARS